MNPLEAAAVLRAQARGSPDARGGGFADVAWRFRHEGEDLVLAGPWARLCEALQALAPESGEWARSGVPLDISYAVSEILASATALAANEEVDSVRRSFAAFAWRVACGWEAVLAGDSEDVAGHVANEARARAIHHFRTADRPRDESAPETDGGHLRGGRRLSPTPHA